MIYLALKEWNGFPKLKWFGSKGSLNILTMQLLGPSLEDHFCSVNRKFTALTVIGIAYQMVKRVEYLHRADIIHQDISSTNFLTGRKDPNRIYIIDFGLADLYRDPKTKKHRVRTSGHRFRGTPLFASVNSHLGMDLSRRDDMESIGYLLVYFIMGGLPWQEMKVEDTEDIFLTILNLKQSTKVAQLCKNAPEEIEAYFRHVKTLRYEDNQIIHI